MANLKRFPNPGSKIEMLIYIFKAIVPILIKKQYFSLYDMELAMISNRLVSSEGYTGMEAFKRSLREDSTRDPIYNQAKMYAEVYRSLGWFSSSPSNNLNFGITEFGRIISQMDDSLNKDIYKESVLGIVDPNKILDKKDGLDMRPFKLFLNTIKSLDNKICKLELIIGPMRISDNNLEDYQNMIENILKLRGSFVNLLNEIKNISKTDKIAKNTMENYTRLPIATLEYLEWITKVKTSSLYPGSRNMVIMKLTDDGLSDIEYYNSLIDIRIEHFELLTEEEKNALIRLAFYQQLKRINEDIDYNYDEKENDEIILSKKYGDNPKFLFSPYQMLSMEYVDSVLNIRRVYSDTTQPLKKEFLMHIFSTETEEKEQEYTELNLLQEDSESYTYEVDNEIFDIISENKEKGFEYLLKYLYEKYENSNKDVFYPLVGDIFNYLGYNCRVSRSGTNYERYDAIIISDKSIPIEIKSPGEEKNISVKAVRQALENKITLLSRKNYSTDWNTSTLIIGFNLPNDRAEVSTLIKNIKSTYNISIGVIDFKTLLTILLNKIFYNKNILITNIEKVEGYVKIKDE